MTSGDDGWVARRLDDLVTFAAEADYLVGRGRDAYLADTHLVARHHDKVNDDVMWAALASRVPRMLASLGLTEPPATDRTR